MHRRSHFFDSAQPGRNHHQLPKDGIPHRAVAMHLPVERLREFYLKLNIKPALRKSIKFIDSKTIRYCKVVSRH